METVVVALLTLIAGAAVSGVVTYLETRRKLSFDYDADLRERRILAYADLWASLEPLAKYAPKKKFSHVEATQLAESLRHWYFEKGGIFLSRDARQDYFAVQEVLGLLDDEWGWTSPECDALTPAAREHLRTCGSRLRTSLIRDVGTRSRPKLRGDVEPVDLAVAGDYARDDGRALRLAFRPRIRGGPALSITELDEDGGRQVHVLEWAPTRMTVRALLLEPGTERRRERVLLLEDDRLVEGPPVNDKTPAPAALWTRRSSTPAPETNRGSEPASPG